jgi:hypothetical protein
MRSIGGILSIGAVTVPQRLWTNRRTSGPNP